MTDEDTYKDIAGESAGESHNAPQSYSSGGTFTKLHRYKIWNPDPKRPDAAVTPGVIMAHKDASGAKTTEVVESVQAVILYASQSRLLKGNATTDWRPICQSHDGHAPSTRVLQPLCRKATAADVAEVVGAWKNFDEAKVSGVVQEVAPGGKLDFCGMQLKNGDVIPLCPYARVDPVTQKLGPCRKFLYLHCYDIERGREFTVELGGKAIQHDKKCKASIHDFYKFLESKGNLPSYAFRIRFEALRDGETPYYMANFRGWQPIADATNRAAMKSRAEDAKESYERQAAWRPQDKVVTATASQSGAAQPVAAQPAQQASAPPKPAVKPQPPPVAQPAPPLEPPEVSFDDDDIPF